LPHCHFNLAKQRNYLFRAKSPLRHDQPPYQDSFSQSAWSKKAKSGQSTISVDPCSLHCMLKKISKGHCPSPDKHLAIPALSALI
jgi:hypothetical protein